MYDYCFCYFTTYVDLIQLALELLARQVLEVHEEQVHLSDPRANVSLVVVVVICRRGNSDLLVLFCFCVFLFAQ